MEKLEIESYLINKNEINNCALSGELCCLCGCKEFNIYYYGKKTKGILSPNIVSINKQIAIKAICKSCGKEITIYNKNYNGLEFNKFMYKDCDLFKVIMKYNYYPGDLKIDDNYTNKYANCFIELKCNKKTLKSFIEE